MNTFALSIKPKTKKLYSTLLHACLLTLMVSCQDHSGSKVVVHTLSPKIQIQHQSQELLSEGNSIRESFIEAAKKTLLEHRLKLLEIVGSEKLELMNYLLNPYHIKTSTEPLYDSNGKPADFLGFKELIMLFVGHNQDVQGWEKIFQDSTLTTRIVLHSLLTSADVNDDLYKTTNKILSISDSQSTAEKIIIPSRFHPDGQRPIVKKNKKQLNEAASTVCGSLSKIETKIPVFIRCNQEKDMTCKVYGQLGKKPLIKMKSSEMENHSEKEAFSFIKDLKEDSQLKCLEYRETFDDCVNDSSSVSVNECVVQKIPKTL